LTNSPGFCNAETGESEVRRILCGLMLVLSALVGRGQSFQNLDFEMVEILSSGSIPIGTALPYWQGFLDGSSLDEVLTETGSLDWAALGLLHRSALFGNSSAFLQESYGFGSLVVELAQTGFVPADAKSIHFYTSRDPFIPSPNSPLHAEDYDFSFKLNGQKVVVSPIAVDPIAVLWAGDVSKVAGTVGEIRWSLLRTDAANRPPGVTPVAATVLLDNISFSSEAVTNLIARPLQDQSTFIGASVHFDVATIDQGPYNYQWFFNGRALIGQTNSALDLENVQKSQAGDYAVKVSNAVISVTSPSARLVIDTIATWGFIRPPPPGLSNVVAIAAGAEHAAALKADGTVSAWGDNYYGQTNVPTGLSKVVAIAAGSAHTLALKSDGTVVAWGSEMTPFGQSLVPVGLSNVVAIAGGEVVSLALKSDGTVTGWGAGFWNGVYLPPTNLTQVVAIAAGLSLGAALSTDGTVAVWGDNSYGQTNVPAGLSNVVAVACGDRHTLVLKSDGAMVAWGDNSYGQTNVPTGLTNVVAISAGFGHCLALSSDGLVSCWGSLTNLPLGIRNVTAISAGSSRQLNFSMALIGAAPPLIRVPVAHPARTLSGFSVTVPTSKARVYQLQYKGSLADSVWKTTPLVAGKGGALTLKDPSITEDQRFYQVRQW
jgi:hypothetical protein